jgi:phosphoribosylformylglycinamidine synthase
MPAIDLALERRLHQLVLRAHAEGLLLSAHDCAEGGLAVALAEGAILGGFGFDGPAELPGRLDAALFGEAQSRIVVTIAADVFRQGGGLARLRDLGEEFGVPVTPLGRTVREPRFRFGPVDSTVDALRAAYEAFLDA